MKDSQQFIALIKKIFAFLKMSNIVDYLYVKVMFPIAFTLFLFILMFLNYVEIVQSVRRH